MIRGAALALLVAVAPHAAAGGVTWPGALAAEGRALTAVPDGDRADAVARFVARFGAEAAAPWLRPLLGAGPPAVRLLAARTLVRIGDPEARGIALGWLTGPSSPPADRALGLDALSWGPASPEVRAAVEQSARDRDALTRAEALDALGRLDGGDPSHLSPSFSVVLGCLDDLDRDVRVRATRLVAQAAAVDPGGAGAAAPLLLERLDDSDRLVRATALRALGALHDPRVVPALLRVAGRDDPAGLQTVAVDALGWPGAMAAVPDLAELLRRRPADEAARHAARALGAIGSPAAVAALVAALRLAPVPEEVGQGLVAAGSAAVGPLLQLLDGPDLGSAARAVPLLARIGDRRAVGPLGRAVRRRAGGGPLVLVGIDALARLRDPDGVAPLAEAAEAADPAVRWAALNGLAALGDPSAAAAADRGLADGDAGVRAAGAALAGRLGLADRAPLLADRLADPAAPVRTAAARALTALAAPGRGALRGLLPRALSGVARRPPAPPPGDDEETALADALEALATDADTGALDAAAATGDLRVLAPALAVAHRRAPLEDRAVVARLLGELQRDPARALAAAEALATARLEDEDRAALAIAAREDEPAVRAGLCEAVARLPDGGAMLRGWMAPDQPVEVRAAAAWAARAHPGLSGTLRALAGDPDAPVAANARAALAAGRSERANAYAARLLAPDGTPLAGRWVTVRAAGVSVAVRSDPRGGICVAGLPDGTASLSIGG